MTLSCSNCGKELPDDAKFCAECGTQVTEEKPKPRFCLQCGVLLTEYAKFCLACGTPVTEDETPWYRKEDKAFEEEMIKDSPLFHREGTTILDFEETKHHISHRAYRWAEHTAKQMSAPEWFTHLQRANYSNGLFFDYIPSQEDWYFPTNKPNAQKALVLKVINQWLHGQALLRGYVDGEGNFSPTAIAYYKLTLGQVQKPEELDNWIKAGLPFRTDFPEFDELAKKDDELFPTPEPLRVEVAGAILNFTTDEGVLVVYVDCAHKGKTVEIDKFSESFIWSDYLDRKAEIIERTCDNTVLCSAIFNHIPFVTNHHRHYQQVLKQMDCTIRSLIPAGFENRWEETVTLFRGHVTELDWRGRRA